MWPAIIAIGLLLLTVISFIVILAPFLAGAFVNGIILWLVLTRGYVEIVKERKEKYFSAGAIIGILALFLLRFRDIGNIWWITTFCTITFIAAHLTMFIEKSKRKKK